MQQQMNQDTRRPEPSVYPLTGICYFLAHPGLWPYALCPLVGGVVVLIFTMIFIFSTLLEPQERLIDSWLGYNAFLCYLIAVLLCLAEIVIATFALLQLVVAVTMEKVPPRSPNGCASCAASTTTDGALCSGFHPNHEERRAVARRRQCGVPLR